ncbi:MAG: hypothetical protein IKE63_02385 [Bacilli bacterium]|nr:hypothetical protein [Bacilli bacterium]
MAITEKQCNELLKTIENDCKEARIKRSELNRLKKHVKYETDDKCNLDIKEIKPIQSSEIVSEEEEFNDEISFYLDNYRTLDDNFTYEDIISVLPTKDNYNYEDIINRLIAESYKEIKEINELLIEDDSLSKEELIECKALIDKEKTKISYLRKSMIEEDEVINDEHKNRIVLVPTIGGNIRVIDELEHIATDYYDSFLELINSIINGKFKNVKTFTSNAQLMGISEVKAFKTRVVFSRLDKNTYALITAFVKKTDTDKLYKDTLKRKASHFKENESLLKEKIKDEEFMRLNNQYVEELFNLLRPKDNELELKKVNNHD